MALAKDPAKGPDGTAQSRRLSASYVLEYTYRRSVGAVLGRFLGGLRDKRIQGIRIGPSAGSGPGAGRVMVPPAEYDPETSEPLSESDLVDVGEAGVVTTWTWVSEPRARQPLDRPFAWALVKLDGADTALLHAVDAGSIDRMATGMRVTARWRAERKGGIEDIACFEPEPESARSSAGLAGRPASNAGGTKGAT